MRFDENFGPEYVFSTDQKVDFFMGNYTAEYYEQKRDLAARGITSRKYVAKNLAKMAIITVVAFLLILGIGLLRYFIPILETGVAKGEIDLPAFLLSTHALGLIQVFIGAVVVGIFTLPGFTDAQEHDSFRVDNSKRCVLSVLSFVVALVSLVLAFAGILDGYENTFFILGFIFAVLALYNTAVTVLILTERSRLYRKTIDNAICIGYVRRLKKVRSGRHGYRTVCYMSPVFEYEVNGQKIAAIYDRMLKRAGSNIALNSEVTLHVDENEPSYVEAPDKYRFIENVILAVIFAFLAFLLLHGVLTGGVDGSSIAI